MPLLTATNISVAYGDMQILQGVSLSVEPGDRIGIVGRNGAGKTTLLKCMTGEVKPDDGSVVLQRGMRAGYLTQDPNLDPEETLIEAAEGAFERLHELHRQLNHLFEEMATASGDKLDALLKQQVTLETEMEAAGGYAIEHKIEGVLHGLGLTDAQFTIKVRNLSGGQRGRLALAKLLLQSPDVLLLDEPTNHLDIEGRMWLEEFLSHEYEGAVVMISHDRYLLDNVVTRILEVEQCRLIDYPGNYEAFRETRALRRLTMHRAYEAQQDKFKKEEAYIRKYKAGQRAKQARGRQTRLEREKESSTLERPMEHAVMRLKLPKAPRSSDMVVSGRGLSKSYANSDGTTRVLFKDLDLTINRGERWGIIGPNGAGKSTLVRCLLGDLAPDAGQVRTGTNLALGFYRQTHEHVNPDETIIRYLQGVILKEAPDQAFSEQQARDLAGTFMFSGPEQEKRLGDLSGGERSRAVIAGLLASAKNLLVLDEPTNHLDIPSAERLEDALALPDEDDDGGFNGTLLLISHDRALIDATCDHLIVLDGLGGAKVFHGNFTEWHEKDVERKRAEARSDADAKAKREEAERRAREAEEEKKRAAAKKDPGKSVDRYGRMKTEQIEQRIEQIQVRLRAIDGELGDPSVWRDKAKSQKLGDERSKLAAELEPLEFEWSRRAEMM